MKEIKLYHTGKTDQLLRANLLCRNWSVVNTLSLKMDYISRQMTLDIISLRSVVEEAISR